MKQILTGKKLIGFAALALLAVPGVTKADVQDRLYDFTDAYYSQNGINPGAIGGRRQPGPLAASDTPNFSYQRPVRMLLTLPAYDQSGNANYFTVLGGLSGGNSMNGMDDGTFTNNAAGVQAGKSRIPSRNTSSRNKEPTRSDLELCGNLSCSTCATVTSVTTRSDFGSTLGSTTQRQASLAPKESPSRMNLPPATAARLMARRSSRLSARSKIS